MLLTAAGTVVVVGFLEISTFLAVVRMIGVTWALLALIACSAAGLLLLVREGVTGRRRLRTAGAQGRPPGPAVVTFVVGLSGAALLALPGFFTAALGLVLLLPPARALIRRTVERSSVEQGDGDLFGPRRVRVRVGKPRRPSDPADRALTVD
ncbi:hypothetical protein L3i22_065230 [Actinoplanes sp. L3-i22]|nr:hypothetical protein L3i22_065230 [Actinoplanes sp. L3-i22]